MIVVGSLKAFALTVALFFLLKQAFNRVTATKPKMLHRVRASYYLVCEGRREDISDALNRLEDKLEHGMKSARNTSWLSLFGEAEKSTLTDQEEREFLDHMEPTWEKQIEAIEMTRKGQRNPGWGRVYNQQARGGRGGRGRGSQDSTVRYR